jgi:hypothetical protein
MGLRQVIVVALAAWAGWLLFRGIVRRKVPWIGLAVIAVPMIVFGVTERQWISAEHAFTAASRVVAPSAPGVHCQRLGETFTYAGAELGHVEWDEDGVTTAPALISYETCQRLTAYWRSNAAEKAAPPLEQVVAVHVLTHESVHLAGDHKEASTECTAMQRDTDVAQALGASPESARRLAETYAAQVYPRMPSGYTNANCVKDGSMDATPGDGIWP